MAHKRYVGVDLSNVRYDKVAQGMNCYGERITEPSEIKPALRRALDSGLPAGLDVEIDRETIPPDLEILAAVWLEGCELPKKVEEVKKLPEEEIPEAVAGIQVTIG